MADVEAARTAAVEPQLVDLDAQLRMERVVAGSQVYLEVPHENVRLGRVIKCLTIAGDAAHESVAIKVMWANLRHGVSRVLDHPGLGRGLPIVRRTDDGKKFCGNAMVAWAHDRSVRLRLIEPGKPNLNTYIESFNGRPRDECLNEQWFPAYCMHALRSRPGAGNTGGQTERRGCRPTNLTTEIAEKKEGTWKSVICLPK